ncbi:cache domain-containing protein [Vibrio sp. SCSIO 43137]|uniref:cache domain-containing protein n=1 Tax=Vibrio sp. SCSIO 43137 TaxID=3021011 RepID=UPI002307B16B|nr:cache domain-containing protein [Vibrio sp. SCSIO 43137]WCE28342.1 cache domain-containing protein [Vibrio sp. SCSIO 43137]
MPLKAKLILLTLIPLIMVTASISWIAIYQAKSLGDKEVEIFRQNLIKSRESALKDSVDLAISAIRPIYDNPSLDKEQAKQAVKQVINELRFGSDGYFFVYDKSGTNVVHPILTNLVGKNLIDLQDENGNYLIEALLNKAQSGGGYHSYMWQKPSTNETVQKLGYVEWLDKWQWMIGTGLYIEDVHQEVAFMQASVNKNIETTFFSVIVILAFTVAVIIVLTLAINLHEHRLADRNLKELAHKTVMFQEDEKKHLARELHDGINQLLVSSKCHLELSSRKLDRLSGGEELIPYMEKSQNSLITAINEVRRISHSLRPSALDDIGLEAALNTLLKDFQSHSEQVDVEIMFDTQDGQLQSEVATTLYRVTQESLTNIEKHARATQVSVILRQMGYMLQLIIRDNGVGFDDGDLSRNKGIGLRNMRERVEFIGGDFELVSEQGVGTEITVLLNIDGLMVWKKR